MQIEMPSKGRDHQNQMPVPFVIYVDFESIIKPTTDKKETKRK
jgi:hypothetical protein